MSKLGDLLRLHEISFSSLPVADRTAEGGPGEMASGYELKLTDRAQFADGCFEGFLYARRDRFRRSARFAQRSE